MSAVPEGSILRSNPVTTGIKQEDPKMYQLRVKLFEKDKEPQCFDSTGKETILNMVKRILRERGTKQKFNLDLMLFRCDSDGSYINIGLPTGALNKEEDYVCNLKPRILKNNCRTRDYEVKDLNQIQALSYFNVKFEKNKHFLVSDLQKSLDVLRVYFIPGETLFVALTKDGRFFYTDALRKSDFKDENDCIVFLTSQATKNTFRITKRNCPNLELPSNISANFNPDIPGTSKQDSIFPAQQNVAATNTCTPIVKEEVQEGLPEKYTHINQYLTTTYKISLEIIYDEKKEKARKAKLENFSKNQFQNFALNYEHRVYVSDLEEILRLKYSVGMVIALNNKNDEVPAGTCFRIGEQFVITNCHVLEKIEEYNFKLNSVDFSYEEEDGNSFLFDSDEPMLVFSKELDYAILKLHLDENISLPNSLTDSDYCIAAPNFKLPENECLTLMGHPGGKMKKQMDISCPLRPPQTPQNNIFTLHKVSARYDVSTFFEGSSGSPGLLMSQKKLVVLHSRGYPLAPPQGSKPRFEVEEGTLMSSIVEDVKQQKNIGNKSLSNVHLNHIFGSLHWDVEASTSDFDEEDMIVD